MQMDYATAYEHLHTIKGGKYFGGKVRGVDYIKALVARCQPANLLDYGSGKGKQYSEQRVHDQWGGIEPTCYDLGVPELRRRPPEKFDGVMSCDMLEHIEPADVDAVLADIFGFVNYPRDGGKESFVYLHISCVPSKGKRLPDGRNVHLCVEPPEWWQARLERFHKPGLVIDARYDTVGGE